MRARLVVARLEAADRRGSRPADDGQARGSADDQARGSADDEACGSADDRAFGSADDRARGSADDRHARGSVDDDRVRGSAGDRVRGSAGLRFTIGLIAAAIAGLSALAGRVAVDRFAGVRLERWPGFVAAAAALDDGGGLVLGPVGAPIRVDIFADYACPACARLERVAGDSLRALASAGLLRLQYHHAPILRRRPDVAHAVLSCAAEAGESWRAHAALYATAAAWTGAADPIPPILDVLRSPGLDECLRARRDGGGHQLAVAAIRAGIREVPTVVVDGMRVHFRRSEALLAYIARRTRRG